jgi:hypothetical protein
MKMASKEFPTYERQDVSHQQSGVPDFSGAFKEFGESNNVLGALGAGVAQVASNKIASDLGAQLGKNPKGNIGPAFTDFDKQFAESYKTQAHATLSLQANQLITDTNLSVAKASRMTPELIEKSQASINLGLSKIYALAPTEIRAQLEQTFTAQKNGQRVELTKRMLNEQHEDLRQNTLLSNNKNAELAHSLAASGDPKSIKAAEDLVATNERLNKSAVASNVGFTVNQAKIGNDSVRMSVISGKLQYGYDKAVAEGKGEEYLTSLAKKPDWISDADYPGAIQSIQAYSNNQKSLKSNNEQLVMAEMGTKLAMDASGVPGVDFQAALDQLNPLNAAKLRTQYVNAIKSQKKSEVEESSLNTQWENPTVHANSDPKAVNKVFNAKVEYAVKNNPGMTREDAENQVAMSAGGRIPVFEKELENKLTSANPQSIASASAQIQTLHDLEAGRVYAGLSQKAKAIAFQFQHQKGSMPDDELARQITDNLTNIDETKQKTLDNIWNLKMSVLGAGGIGATKSFADLALKETGLNKDKLGGKYFATIYGNDIYDQLHSNFNSAGGDYATAKKMTQDYVREHYGETYINGGKQITDSPIEKYLGYKGREATPFIQQDILNQLTEAVKGSKENNPNDYWETLPFNGKTPELLRHVRTKDGMKQYRYPVNIVGRAGDQWDVVVDTPYDRRNLFLVAPHLGVTTYTPNKAEIDKNIKAHSHKGWF